MLSYNQINQVQIKQINRINILNLLRRKDSITKHDIANKLNISITTVTTNINELMDSGLVEEAGVAESTGGRKPLVVMQAYLLYLYK